MIQLSSLANNVDQTITALLADGSSVVLTFHYKLTIQRWSVDIVHGNFTANNLILSTHPNMLRVWRNVLPFGLQVNTTDGTDPFLLEDFISGRVTVAVLDSTGGNTDVQDVEKEYFT